MIRFASITAASAERADTIQKPLARPAELTGDSHSIAGRKLYIEFLQTIIVLELAGACPAGHLSVPATYHPDTDRAHRTDRKNWPC